MLPHLEPSACADLGCALTVAPSVIGATRREGRTQMGEMILATREMMRLIAAYTEGIHARRPQVRHMLSPLAHSRRHTPHLTELDIRGYARPLRAQATTTRPRSSAPSCAG